MYPLIIYPLAPSVIFMKRCDRRMLAKIASSVAKPPTNLIRARGGWESPVNLDDFVRFIHIKNKNQALTGGASPSNSMYFDNKPSQSSSPGTECRVSAVQGPDIHWG